MEILTTENVILNIIKNSPQDITAASIIETASNLGLCICLSDIQADLNFLKDFKNNYPQLTTTSKQFSLLIIFFAIRHSHKSEIYQEDKLLIPHLKNIHLHLKKKKGDDALSPAQIDFYKWFFRGK